MSHIVLGMPLRSGLTVGRKLFRFRRGLGSVCNVGRGKPAGFEDAIALVDILLDRALHPALLQRQRVIEASALGPCAHGCQVGVKPTLYEAGDLLTHRREQPSISLARTAGL